MILQVSDLPQPEQGGQVVAEQVLLAFLALLAQRNGLGEVGHMVPPVLLEELLSTNAARIAAKRERPVPQMAQQMR